MKIAEVETLALSPEDLLLHLCQHSANHTHVICMRMLCDIGEVIRRFKDDLNWPELGARAGKWGMLRAVYVLLRLARELLKATVADDWLDSIRPDDFDQHYLALIRRQIVSDHPEILKSGIGQTAARFKGLAGASSKTAFIFKRLFLLEQRWLINIPCLLIHGAFTFSIRCGGRLF